MSQTHELPCLYAVSDYKAAHWFLTNQGISSLIGSGNPPYLTWAGSCLKSNLAEMYILMHIPLTNGSQPVSQQTPPRWYLMMAHLQHLDTLLTYSSLTSLTLWLGAGRAFLNLPCLIRNPPVGGRVSRGPGGRPPEQGRRGPSEGVGFSRVTTRGRHPPS
jgi:hypothetical protein